MSKKKSPPRTGGAGRTTSPAPFQLEGDRQIYRYANGEYDTGGNPIIVSGDPIRIHIELISTEGLDLIEACQLVESGDNAASAEALKELVPAIRRAFNVREYGEDGRVRYGLTGLECLALLYHFFGFLDWLGKDSPRSATSARPTERGSSAASSPTSNSAPSTSSAAELHTVKA
jgi:hypothetical protein